MPASFEIASATGSYTVRIEQGLYASLKAKADGNTVVMCDARFADELKAAGLKVIALTAEETQKSLDSIPDLIVQLRKLGANRKTRLLAIGGGIVQDTAAFCASIYMRGLNWTYAPTTLLGMSDSCIGGKSSINVGAFKNIVGTFYPPQQVLIDPSLCATLSPEQWALGLIEAAKICMDKDAACFERYLALNPHVGMPVDALEQVITLSLQAKKWFIETDEFDQNERLLLNFGHTFGHAIEGATHFAVSHGIGVGLGCLSALSLARRLGYQIDGHSRVGAYEHHMRALLAHVPEVASPLRAITVADLMDRFESDKKHGADHFTVVTVDDSGLVVLVRLPKTAESRAHISGAFEDMLKAYQMEITAA